MSIYNPIWRIRSVNWQFFDWIVRSKRGSLLARLKDFEHPVLVGGCQRSGTTAVTKMLSSTRQITSFRLGVDNELDGALILAGAVRFDPEKSSRYCFQVTYLNDSLLELCSVRENFKMVWVIRNPYSVVYSMLYNWRASALEQLYRSCTSTSSVYSDTHSHLLAGANKERRRLIKACISYSVRSSQLFELAAIRAKDKLHVIDYDELVSEPRKVLPPIFRFLKLTLEESQLGMINPNSMNKASSRLTNAERQLVEEVCYTTYSRCREYISTS